MPRVLVIDNFDSFVHNLADSLLVAGASVAIVRNDEVDLAAVVRLRASGDLTHLLISPGPCGPDEAGICVPAVRALAPTTPILGVCLGHQVIGAAFGGSVVRASEPVHGQRARISHDGMGMLRGLPTDPWVARYHSLVVDPRSLPARLSATSWTVDGELMGLRHAQYAHVEGVQWHPESILTADGGHIMRSFLATSASVTRQVTPCARALHVD